MGGLDFRGGDLREVGFGLVIVVCGVGMVAEGFLS